jgi:hypothetical protein
LFWSNGCGKGATQVVQSEQPRRTVLTRLEIVGAAYENTVSAEDAIVADIVPDCIEMVPAVPVPGGVRATIVVALHDTRTKGNDPMAAVAWLQSAPNLDPVITTVSFPTVFSMFGDAVVTATRTTFEGVLLTMSA